MNNNSLAKPVEVLGNDFKNIFDNIPDGILIADPKNKKFYMGNPAICQMLGYTQEEIKLLGVSDIHPEKDLPYILDQFEKLFNGEIKLSGDLPVKKKDGTILFADVNASSITIAGTIYLMGFFHDITARRKIEESLLKSEKKFRIMFESSRDAIMVLEPPSWRFTACNPATVKLFGASSEAEFISKVPWEVSPEFQPDGEASLEKAKKMIQKAIEEGSSYFEWTHKRLGGRDFFATVLLTKFEIEKGNSFLQATVRDITEFKKSEEALKNSRDELETRVKERTETLEKTNKEFENSQSALINVMEDLQLEKSKAEAILASMGDGVIATDKDANVMVANEKIEELTAWKRDEIFGKKWFELIPMEDENGNPIPEDKTPIIQALAKGNVKIFTTGTFYLVRKDKLKLPVAVTTTPIILNGDIIGAIGVYRDITKELEIDRMKTEFMDIAAHDLRTPAAAIRGFISRVLDGDAGEISDKAKGFLKEAYEGNMRLIRLVDDFLTVSRIERGKVKITPKARDLANIIQTSVDELSEIAKSKGLTLEYKKEQLPVVMVDKDRTIEILNNLIGNAIKFTQKGGITVSNTINKDEVITNVTDTGVGIPPETLPHLFQKYYKGSEATTQSGLGLGLYISRLCVEGSGGMIWVKSKVGEGTTFSFSLPIAK